MGRGRKCSACHGNLELGEQCSCTLEEGLEARGEGEVVEMEVEEKPDVNSKVDVSSKEYLSSVPPGWRVKELQVGFGSIIKQFVDSGGKTYKGGRIGAMRGMAAAGRQEELVVLRQGLAMDGWLEHDLLPKGWWARPDSSCKDARSARKLSPTT